MLFRRGDIILVDFDPAQQGEAAQTRPAIIVSNNLVADAHHVVVVVPLTSNLERVFTHETVLPNNRTGLDYDSKVQVQYVRHLHKRRIVRVIGYVPADLMAEVDALLREYLAL